MATTVLNVPATHALNSLSESLKHRIVTAQTNLFEMEFKSAADLLSRSLSDLKIAIKPPRKLKDSPASHLGDMTSKDLIEHCSGFLARNGIPDQAVSLHASNLSHRIQLLRAFDEPDHIIKVTCKMIEEKIARFPTTAEQIRCGRNPGDVLDPYILSCAQILMYSGNFESTISATVAHKDLMIIEGFLGNLHETVIGNMRGNVHPPKSSGKDKEILRIRPQITSRNSRQSRSHAPRGNAVLDAPRPLPSGAT
jgi:hypothetical protein